MGTNIFSRSAGHAGQLADGEYKPLILRMRDKPARVIDGSLAFDGGYSLAIRANSRDRNGGLIRCS